jgi:GMP synthase-like glutamine amidotransferase
MRALAIVHQRDAGPGVFADAIEDREVGLDRWLIAEVDSPPADPASYGAVLTFGGAMHVDQEDRHGWLRAEKALLAELLDRDVPLLGVCLGAELLGEAAGARPRRLGEPEIGWREVTVTDAARSDPLLAPLAPSFVGFQWHSYAVPLPPGATELARSPACLQAFRLGDAAWGIQFHAEVTASDAESWIDDYRSDEDAVRSGLDPKELRRRTREAIGDWNEIGRAICGRFIDAALARA